MFSLNQRPSGAAPRASTASSKFRFTSTPQPGRGSVADGCSPNLAMYGRLATSRYHPGRCFNYAFPAGRVVSWLWFAFLFFSRVVRR